MNPITQIPKNARLVVILRAHTDTGSMVTALLHLDDYEALPENSEPDAFTPLVLPIDDLRFNELDLNTFSLCLLIPLEDNEHFHLIPMARVPGMPFEHPDADNSRAMCTLIAGVKDMELRSTFLAATRRIYHQRHDFILKALQFIRDETTKKTTQAPPPSVDGELGGS